MPLPTATASRRAERLRQLALEGLALGAEDEPSRVEHAGDRGVELVAQRRHVRLEVDERDRRAHSAVLTSSAPCGAGSTRPWRRAPRAAATRGAQPSVCLIARDVGVEVADVDALALGRERHEPRRRRRPATSSSSFGELEQRDRVLVAEVEDLAVGGVARARAQERVHDVVDVVEVALLAAVAEDLDLLAEARPAARTSR